MPSISYKIGLYKAFKVYPKDEDIEFIVNPDIVGADRYYVIDRQAIDSIPGELMVNFTEGLLDDHFKVFGK